MFCRLLEARTELPEASVLKLAFELSFPEVSYLIHIGCRGFSEIDDEC